MITIVTICSLFIGSCGKDSTSIIVLVKIDDNGLYYWISALSSSEGKIRYYDALTDSSENITDSGYQIMNRGSHMMPCDLDDEVILYNKDNQSVYQLRDHGIEYVTALNFDVVHICAPEDMIYEPYIYKIENDLIYWGIVEYNFPEGSEDQICMGVYKQNLYTQEASVIYEKIKIDKDSCEVIGAGGNDIYMLSYEQEQGSLWSIDMESGEERKIYEDELFLVESGFWIYEDSIIWRSDNNGFLDIWEIDLDTLERQTIARTDEYHSTGLGICYVDDMIYYVSHYYDDNDHILDGIAAADAKTKSVFLYQELSTLDIQTLHVSDIFMGKDGFYFINSTNSKVAGGGLYYYNMQDKSNKLIEN